MIGFKHFSRTSRVAPGTNLILVPFGIAGTVMVMLVITLVLDGLGGGLLMALPPWVSVGNIDDARAILGAILGSVSTVLALIFSVTLLVFSMAASQFGPRLISYFLRDRTMQVTLGLFLATFLHALVTFVVAGRRGDTVFVPQLTVLTSVGLVLVSFGYLVVYNNRVAQAIQTNNVLPHIVENLYTAISELSQPRVIQTAAAPAAQVGETAEDLRARCAAEGRPVLSATSGYMQRIDHGRLALAADQREAVVCMAFGPGQFVLEGEALAYVLPAERGADLTAAIHGAVMIGQHRTLEQDIEFAFAQLSEIAIRALSPAINDTYTGLSCIDWLGDAFRMLVALPNPDGVWHTRHGQPRLLVPPLRIASIVRAAFDLIREAGASSPAVIVRLLQTYARLAAQLRSDEQRNAILEEVEAAGETMARVPAVALDQQALDAAYRLARDRLTVSS
jgi:uncharacterized membrane protein